MIKYTKKQQKFISDLYGYDLEKFESRVESLAEFYVEYESYLEKLENIFQFSRELIRANTGNADNLFKLAKTIQDQLQSKCDLLIEESSRGDLLDGKKNELNLLEDVVDSLRILNNLHPDRILTWEEVNPIAYAVFPK